MFEAAAGVSSRARGRRVSVAKPAKHEAEAGGGKLEVGSAGVGGESKAARETLTRDGVSKACEAASKNDESPPEGCSSLLRLEVLPIGGVIQANGCLADVIQCQGGWE